MHNALPICVDASVVVQFVVHPEDGALRNLWEQWRDEQRRLVAPGLIRYEITNALHRYGVVNPAGRKAFKEALVNALSYPIELHDRDWLHLSAFDFAARFHLPAAYDSHYLALSDHLGCELWTGDRKLFNSVSPSLSWVRLVAS